LILQSLLEYAEIDIFYIFCEHVVIYLYGMFCNDVWTHTPVKRWQSFDKSDTWCCFEFVKINIPLPVIGYYLVKLFYLWSVNVQKYLQFISEDFCLRLPFLHARLRPLDRFFKYVHTYPLRGSGQLRLPTILSHTKHSLHDTVSGFYDISLKWIGWYF
jgi:hypothetical protein